MQKMHLSDVKSPSEDVYVEPKAMDANSEIEDYEMEKGIEYEGTNGDVGSKDSTSEHFEDAGETHLDFGGGIAIPFFIIIIFAKTL